jgi:hypothetical protein
VHDATFATPDLTTFCRLSELGLEVTGQRLERDRAVLVCRVVEPDRWCRRCGCEGLARDTVTRRLAHEPFGWRPTTRQCPAGWWALRVDPRCLLAAVDCGDGGSIAVGLEERHGAFGEVAAVA